MEKHTTNLLVNAIVDVIIKFIEFYFKCTMNDSKHKLNQICISSINLLASLLVSCGLIMLIWIGIQIALLMLLSSYGTLFITLILIGVNIIFLIISLCWFFKSKNKLITYF